MDIRQLEMMQGIGHGMELEMRHEMRHNKKHDMNEYIKSEITNFVDSKLDELREKLNHEIRSVQKYDCNMNINDYLRNCSLKSSLPFFPEQRIRMIDNKEELTYEEPPTSIDIKFKSVGNTDVKKFRVLIKSIDGKSNYKIHPCIVDIDLEKNIRYQIRLKILNNKEIIKNWEKTNEKIKLVLKGIQCDTFSMKEIPCSDETTYIINISKKNACINYLDTYFGIRQKFPLKIILAQIEAAKNNPEEALNRLLQYYE